MSGRAVGERRRDRDHARDAFTDSLVQTGLIGGLTLLAVAAVIFALIPRNLDITEQRH